MMSNNLPNVNTNANASSMNNLAMRVYMEMVEALTAVEQQKLVHNLRTQLVPQTAAPPPPPPPQMVPNNTLLVADALNTLLQAQANQAANPLALVLAAANQQAANNSAIAAIAQSFVNPSATAAAQVTQTFLSALASLPAVATAPPSLTTQTSANSVAPTIISGGPFQLQQPTAINGLVLPSTPNGNGTKRAVSDLSSSSGDDSSGSSNKRQRTSAAVTYERDTSFLHYHDEKWNFHFQELVAFKKKHGHCNVPYGFEENKALSRWVKRQRYQYKQKMEGRTQAMPESRIRKLDQVGFVWGAQELLWQTRFHELKEYKSTHGHCNVPYIYDPNPKLAIWVKCQRRQYKLLKEQKASNMNAKRIHVLNELGFVWTQRKPTTVR